MMHWNYEMEAIITMEKKFSSLTIFSIQREVTLAVLTYCLVMHLNIGINFLRFSLLVLPVSLGSQFYLYNIKIILLESIGNKVFNDIFFIIYITH
jgi:hypothetical protein